MTEEMLMSAPDESVETENPTLWQGAEGGRSAAFCHYLFEAAYPHAGADAYLRWKREGAAKQDLQDAYDRALFNYANHHERHYLLGIGRRFGLGAGSIYPD